MTGTTRYSFRAYSAIYWGLLLCATPLAAFAGLLHRHTHHRPLGAVTFVLGAGAVAIVGALVAQRCKGYGGGVWLACRVAALLSALLPVLVVLASLSGR